jgi:hypothetical protein
VQFRSIVVTLALLVVVGAFAWTAAAQTAPVAVKAPAVSGAEAATALTRGTQIAEAVSTITSTAVSPLLGVCVLGAYEYWRTPHAARAQLPFYTKPVVWIPIAILLVLILGKDTIGGAAPLFKKPLDAVEVLMLNKASLFLLGVPVVVHEVGQMMGFTSLAQLLQAIEPTVYAQSSGSGSVVAQTASGALTALLIALGCGLTFTVWVVGHALDVLVLLSPFPFVDLMLKGLRALVFAVLAGLTILDPKVAAVLSVFVFLLCALLAGWAVRLLVFGAVFSSDLLGVVAFANRADPREGDGLRGFTVSKIESIPRRSYVKLLRNASDGSLELRYRPWLLGLEQRVVLPRTAGYDIGFGFLYPSLIETKDNSSGFRQLVRLLPRYRKTEMALARILGVKGIRDIRFGAGLGSFWKWLRDDSEGTAMRSGR